VTDSTAPAAEDIVDSTAPIADIEAADPAPETPADATPENPADAETPVDAETPAGAAADESAPAAPRERIGRGALFALGALPAGVLVWVLVWQLGFISAIVAFGVVIAATFLYRLGSGGRVGKGGLAVILGITVVTLVVAFLAGLAVEMGAALGYVLPASLTDPLFWDDFAYNVFDNPELWSELTFSIVMTIVFTILGTFGVVRQLSKEARAAV
jgi:hypothetical protein